VKTVQKRYFSALIVEKFVWERKVWTSTSRCLPRTLFRIKYGTVPMVDTQMVTEGVIAEEVLLTDRTLISSVIHVA
jgi:hypothetical protein